MGYYPIQKLLKILQLRVLGVVVIAASFFIHILPPKLCLLLARFSLLSLNLFISIIPSLTFKTFRIHSPPFNLRHPKKKAHRLSSSVQCLQVNAENIRACNLPEYDGEVKKCMAAGPIPLLPQG